MPVTIREVAKRLNLSTTTVSRALDRYDDVAEETRQLVIQAAHEMGYVPNQAVYQAARKLVQMLTARIAGQELTEKHVQIEPVLKIRQSSIGI